MMEDASTPTFLGFSAEECHAITFGLKSGLKFWNRSHTGYKDIDTLDISPELKADLKAKFHYLTIAEDLPEDICLLACVAWFGYCDLPALMKLGGSFFGMG